eukprot:Platyproteum_vivax@DN4999_c0_g1_i1.p1
MKKPTGRRLYVAPPGFPKSTFRVSRPASLRIPQDGDTATMPSPTMYKVPCDFEGRDSPQKLRDVQRTQLFISDQAPRHGDAEEVTFSEIDTLPPQHFESFDWT